MGYTQIDAKQHTNRCEGNTQNSIQIDAKGTPRSHHYSSTISSIILILFQYCSSTSPVLFQYYSSTIPVLFQYYSSIIPVLLQYYSSIIPVLFQYYSRTIRWYTPNRCEGCTQSDAKQHT